jgi:hypothetical protein
MDHEIKSAREIAMEKIAALEEVTDADRLKWKYVPEGEKLAVNYLKDGVEVAPALAGFGDKARPYVTVGAEEVLLSNIQIPRNEAVAATNKKSMDALVSLKKDKPAATKLLSQMKQILGHYTDQGAEQRKHTYEELKRQYETKLKQAMSKKLGSREDVDLGISVETLPQFQEEWRRVSAQMDEQYIKLIEEYKREFQKVK